MTDPLNEPTRPRGVSIHWLLTGVIGGTMLTAMIAVYALGFWVAASNTRTLLQSVVSDAVNQLVRQVRSELRPAADAARFSADQIARFGPPATRRDLDVLRASLALSPQLTGAVFLGLDGNGLRYPGFVDDPLWEATRNSIPDEAWFRWRGNPDIANAMADMAYDPRPSWNEPVLNQFTGEALVVARHPVMRQGDFAGMVGVAVTTADLSRFVGTVDIPGATAFILYGRDFVLAYPGVANEEASGRTRAEPLSPILELNDPVLNAFRRGEGEPLWVLRGLRDVHGRALSANGREYVMLWREVREFGDVPWLIGVHIDVDQEGTEVLLDRLAGAAAIGLVVILAATIALQMVARRVREPMQALAALSNRVRALDFGVETVGKPSIVREINEVNVAFGRMLAGLRWFETYVPKNLVLSLMRRAETAEIASEERMVTVMFTDIAGFTSISEARTPADLATLLNTHFTLINQCVEAEDGTVDKYIGDSVMAFWGAPTEQPDHAARACRAVAAIAADLATYNAKRLARGRQPIRMRIGLHSGLAVAGNIGSPGRINYTLVGDTVNVANRLEQFGKQIDGDAECMILASAETRELAGEAVTFEFVGEHKLRGRSEDTPVYRVITV